VYKSPKKKQLDQEAIPTTSLADMMFLLLIFFIMTTTLSRVTGFVTDMPSGSSGSKTAAKDKTPTVTLQGEEIRMNDEVTNMASLKNSLQALHLDLKEGSEKIVVVTTVGNVTYQTYFQVLSTIQICGGVVAIISEDGGGKK
jgi:biopolymer transport protein ExbD